jgi:hypothetical protein
MLMRSALLWDITRRRVVIVYRSLGKTYRSCLHGSKETSVNNYHTTQRNIPEERRPYGKCTGYKISALFSSATALLIRHEGMNIHVGHLARCPTMLSGMCLQSLASLSNSNFMKNRSRVVTRGQSW